MSKIVIFGATGYAGGSIAREAIARGHEVLGVARNIDGKELEGGSLVAGDIADLEAFANLIEGATDVVLALRHGSPKISDLIPDLAKLVSRATARLSVVGGAGSLFTHEGGPRVFDTPEFPDAYKHEAHSAYDSLRALEQIDNLDWFYVSPAGMFGGFNPGERTGKYRIGSDILVKDADGKSYISGADFAIAFVDEIEKPEHHNRRFTVAY